MKTLKTLICAALIAGSSFALADESISLNAAELDGVTAGGGLIVLTSNAVAGAGALGILSVSATATATGGAGTVDTDVFGPLDVVSGGTFANSESASISF